LKRDKYLFVNTFNDENSEIRLVIPYEAWHSLGISTEGRCKLIDPFGIQKQIDFFVKTSFWSEGNSAGIVIPNQKYSFQIWKIDVQ